MLYEGNLLQKCTDHLLLTDNFNPILFVNVGSSRTQNQLEGPKKYQQWILSIINYYQLSIIIN